MPYKMVTKDFLKAVLKGEKKMLKQTQVKMCSVPHYGEIGVKHQYTKALQLPGMKEYFPDKLPK